MAKIITEKKFRFELSEHKKKERIDVFLANSIENASRTRVQKLIEAGYVTVNDKKIKSNYTVQPNDIIVVTIPIAPRPEEIEPEDIPLEILFEDDYLIVLNKPPGMVVHPALGHYSGTLVHALLHHTTKLSKFNSETRPGIIHRIDKDTSGLLVVAKDQHVHAYLARQFSAHSVEREYWSIVWGRLKKNSGEIEGNIGRSNKDRKKFTVVVEGGKSATTFYNVIEEYEFASLLALKLKTGRTHQIRVHLSHIGHPVFGDDFYGGRSIQYGSTLPKIKSRVENLLEVMPRQALHAKTLGFIHPITKEQLRFDSQLPEDFKRLILLLKRNK